MLMLFKKIHSVKKSQTIKTGFIKIKYESFHSTSHHLMWTRFTTPAKRYGVVFGLGWSAQKVYDDTHITGKLEASLNEGASVIQVKGKIINKDYTVVGNYGHSEGVKGKIEKTNFTSNNDISPIIDSSISLSPFTEKLIQFSLILGLAIEISLIVFCCFGIYSYGISAAYTIFKKKLNSLKFETINISLVPIVLFATIIWLAALQYAFDLLVEHSCKNSMEIVKLKSIIDGIYTI